MNDSKLLINYNFFVNIKYHFEDSCTKKSFEEINVFFCGSLLLAVERNYFLI